MPTVATCMTQRDTPRLRPGRPPRFTRQDAVSAALDVGISRFTMAAVAKKLSVTTPALYRCFPSRDSLLDACLETIAEHITIPTSRVHWRVFLEDVAEGWWTLFNRFPGLDLILMLRHQTASKLLPAGEILRAGVTCHGFSDAQATFALGGIADLTTAATNRLHLVLTGPHHSSDLVEGARAQWRQLVDFFLDHLAETAPDWPCYAGPYRNLLPGVSDG